MIESLRGNKKKLRALAAIVLALFLVDFISDISHSHHVKVGNGDQASVSSQPTDSSRDASDGKCIACQHTHPLPDRGFAVRIEFNTSEVEIPAESRFYHYSTVVTNPLFGRAPPLV
jgi:hypothetical protein